MRKFLLILVAVVGFALSVSAEDGNYCTSDGGRLELYSNGAFQLRNGSRVESGTYQINYNEGTILLECKGEKLFGRFYRGIKTRTGGTSKPASVDLLGFVFIKGQC